MKFALMVMFLSTFQTSALAQSSSDRVLKTMQSMEKNLKKLYRLVYFDEDNKQQEFEFRPERVNIARCARPCYMVTTTDDDYFMIDRRMKNGKASWTYSPYVEGTPVTYRLKSVKNVRPQAIKVDSIYDTVKALSKNLNARYKLSFYGGDNELRSLHFRPKHVAQARCGVPCYLITTTDNDSFMIQRAGWDPASKWHYSPSAYGQSKRYLMSSIKKLGR